MKKTTITLTTLGLLAILSCGLVGYLSCRQEQVNNCSNCQITSQEESQLSAYATGDKAVFKNDTTGAIDTLGISSKSETLSFCSYPCNNTEISLSVRGNFLNNSFTIFISHNSPPGSAIPYIGFSGIDVTFPLGGTMQSMTINSISYNDVFNFDRFHQDPF